MSYCMNYLKTIFLPLLAVVLSINSAAQSPLGSWKSYLNHSRAVDIDFLESEVYVANQNGLFIYDTLDHSTSRLSRINGLSDIGIVLLRAYRERGLVFVGYQNGNLDIISDRTITNFSDIKNSQVVGDKSIRNISFLGKIAYISTGVGILKLDIERREVSDSYTISPTINVSVNETALLNDTLFAATEEGLFAGALSSDLTIFSNWKHIETIPGADDNVLNVTAHNGRLYLNQPSLEFPGLYIRDPNLSTWSYINGTPFISDVRSSPGGLTLSLGFYAELKQENGFTTKTSLNSFGDKPIEIKSVVADTLGNIWIADGRLGLVRSRDGESFEFILPDGPASNRAFDLDFDDGILAVATGAPVSPGNWNNGFVLEGFYVLEEGVWKNYTRESYPVLLDQLFFDAARIFIDSEQDETILVGSFFSGFLEANDGIIQNFYSADGTSLGERREYPRSDGLPWVGVAGFARDGDGNLWVANSYADEPMSVRTKDGTWKSFSLISGSEGLGVNKLLFDMLVDRQGQKWSDSK